MLKQMRFHSHISSIYKYMSTATPAQTMGSNLRFGKTEQSECLGEIQHQMQSGSSLFLPAS